MAIAQTKVPIISNCQAQPLAKTMARYCPSFDFDDFGVHLLGSPPDIAKIQSFVEAYQSAKIIITVNLSEQYGPISSSKIKDTFPSSEIITIQSLYFSGLHPDLTYIGGRGERAVGPLGDYHSKLAAAAWLFNISAEDAEKKFNYDTYKAIGYFDEMEISFKEMHERSKHLDVQITDQLRENVLQHEMFFSVNHPTSFVFSVKAYEIAKKLNTVEVNNRFKIPISPTALPNFLALNNIFPVYPEIAEYHQASIASSYEFIGALPGQKQAIYSLREFIQGEYECFERVGATRISETPVIQGLMQQIREIM